MFFTRACFNINLPLCFCLEVEFGAGDILGPLIGLKMFRNVTPRRSAQGWMHAVLAYKQYSLFVVPFSTVISFHSFLTAQGGLQFSPRGLRPSCSLMTARHLDQNTMGYLQWRWGPNSAMTTSLVRDTKTSHFTLALQVHTKSRFRKIFKLIWLWTDDTCHIYLDVLNHFLHSYPFQLGVPHSYLMMSYHYKFQDDDQTKVKGSVK